MARPAADHEADLARTRPLQGHQSALRSRDRPQEGAVGVNGPFEHLLDDRVRLIDELLDVISRLMRALLDRLLVAGALVEFLCAVSAQDAARGGRIGDEHVGIAAAKRRENRRHLVEPAGHADAQVDAKEIVERQADHAIVERPDNQLSPGVDEARHQHAHGVSIEVALEVRPVEHAVAV